MDWEAALGQAAGDDEALLALARGAAPVEIKLAAVGALASVDALKRAERELRKHDRRVYRLAKQRCAELLARRDARMLATQLTATACAMLDEPLIAANRLVELDRAWQGLDAALLEGTQAADFTALFARLGALARERADRAHVLERWNAAARDAAAGLAMALSDAAAGAIDRTALASSAAQAQSVLDAAPNPAEPVASQRDALRDALGAAAAVGERLELLDELLQSASASASASASGLESPAVAEPESAADEDAGIASLQGDAGKNGTPQQPTRDAAQRWRALAPVADARIAQALDARFLQWQRAQRQPKPEHRATMQPAATIPSDPSRLEALGRHVENAEAALAEGHLADAGTQQSAIDALLRGGAVPATLRARIDRLHAQLAQLKGWQHWGGARARDELVAQAEALAAADAGTDTSDAVARLTTRQRAELIGELRARWKELDRHSGASNRSLWQRFDAALKSAYAPVAAHAEAQRTSREQNLQTRLALLDTLEAVALPGDDGAEGKPAGGTAENATEDPPARDASAVATADATEEATANADANTPAGARANEARGAPADAPADASEGAPQTASQGASVPGLEAAPGARSGPAALAAALADFHSAWRKLGPLEHTVPRAERDRLQTRMHAAVARIEGPLNVARRIAQAQRERLIARARALAEDPLRHALRNSPTDPQGPLRGPSRPGGLMAASAAQGRDGLDKVRALQAEWQQTARSVPLARAVENALWADFKSAIDAIYDARHADMAARDAEVKAQGEARRSLIARLEEAAAAGDAADTLERMLAEVDAQWRQAGAAPRAEAVALEARFRSARDAAQALATNARQRRWRAQCNALIARLAERDGVHGDGSGSGTEIPSQASDPTAQTQLPQQWEHALAQQSVAAHAQALPNDDLLLKLEVALGIDSPPAFHDARRALKLQAMKAALEARPAAAAASLAADALLAEAIAHRTFDSAHRERLRRAIEAVRERDPMRID